jgi:hypothetical protein
VVPTLALALVACSADGKREEHAGSGGDSRAVTGGSAAAGRGGAQAATSGGADAGTGTARALSAAGAGAGAGGARAATSGGGASGRNSQPAAQRDDNDAGADDEVAIKPPPDPSITFEWEQTAPGVDQTCRAGDYVGTFMCALDTGDTGVIQITGPVRLSLTKSANGEFLEIADGHIDGFALDVFNFSSGLSGMLDCGTRGLSAMAKDGAVGLGDAMLLPVFQFAGVLSGTLDASGTTLSGDWSFPVTTVLGDIGTCTGPWTATRMP